MRLPYRTSHKNQNHACIFSLRSKNFYDRGGEEESGSLFHFGENSRSQLTVMAIAAGTKSESSLVCISMQANSQENKF